MLVANIKNNQPHCPQCEIILRDKSVEVYLVECEDRKYFEFLRRCNKCGRVFNYYIDTEFVTRTDLKGKEVRRISGEW